MTQSKPTPGLVLSFHWVVERDQFSTYKNRTPEDKAVQEASRTYGPADGIPAGMEVHGHRARYWLSPLDVSAIDRH